MLRLKWISHPHRGIGRCVIVCCVVALTAYRVLQLLGVRIERTITYRRQLEPTLGWHNRWLWRCQCCCSRLYRSAICCIASRIDRVGRIILQLHIAHLCVGLCCAYVVGCCCCVRGACEVERYKSVGYILRALHRATRRRHKAVERSRYVS